MQREFYYQARDCSGKLVTGRVHAASRDAAAAEIQLKGCFVTKLQEKHTWAKFTEFNKNFASCDKQQLALLFKELAMLLQAGVPLLQCLIILQQEAESQTIKMILANLRNSVQAGISLSQAMQAESKFFSNFIICLIAVGENSGRLDEILQRLSNYLTKSVAQREKVKSAILYPAFVMIIAICVLLILVLYVLPVFADLFDSMRLTLPWPTQILLNFTAVIGAYGIWGGVSLLVCCLTITWYGHKPQGRRSLDKLLIKTPIVGEMIFKTEAAHYAHVLSVLLESGVPLLAALAAAAKLADNKYVGDLWQWIINDIQAGKSLTESLKKLPIKANLLIQMIAVGEKTGKLEFMLDRTATMYDESVNERLHRFTILLEPCLTIILGIVVGGIVVSIALPIFESINQAIS